MFKNQIKIKMLSLLCLGLFISSCTKEDSSVEVENYGFTESYTMQKNMRAGVHGCLELVFPLTIQLPDETEISVDSFEDAKDQLQAWKEDNPDVKGRSEIVFPIEVINADGEVVSVSSHDEIKELVRDCRSQYPPRPRHFRACFNIVFPVTISFPDGTTAEVSSRQELKELVRAWREDNPDAQEKPELAFPLTIEYEDGTTAEVNSAQELREAKRECRER